MCGIFGYVTNKEEALGPILIAAADQILDHSPWKSNNVLQLLIEGLKTVFRVKG